MREFYTRIYPHEQNRKHSRSIKKLAISTSKILTGTWSLSVIKKTVPVLNCHTRPSFYPVYKKNKWTDPALTVASTSVTSGDKMDRGQRRWKELVTGGAGLLRSMHMMYTIYVMMMMMVMITYYYYYFIGSTLSSLTSHVLAFSLLFLSLKARLHEVRHRQLLTVGAFISRNHVSVDNGWGGSS